MFNKSCGKEPEVSPSSRLIKNPRFLPAVATDRYLIKGSAEDHGSERGLPTIRPLVATSAFVGTNPTDEPITSGLSPSIRAGMDGARLLRPAWGQMRLFFL